MVYHPVMQSHLVLDFGRSHLGSTPVREHSPEIWHGVKEGGRKAVYRVAMERTNSKHPSSIAFRLSISLSCFHPSIHYNTRLCGSLFWPFGINQYKSLSVHLYYKYKADRRSLATYSCEVPLLLGRFDAGTALNHFVFTSIWFLYHQRMYHHYHQLKS